MRHTVLEEVRKTRRRGAAGDAKRRRKTDAVHRPKNEKKMCGNQ